LESSLDSSFYRERGDSAFPNTRFMRKNAAIPVGCMAAFYWEEH